MSYTLSEIALSWTWCPVYYNIVRYNYPIIMIIKYDIDKLLFYIVNNLFIMQKMRNLWFYVHSFIHLKYIMYIIFMNFQTQTTTCVYIFTRPADNVWVTKIRFKRVHLLHRSNPISRVALQTFNNDFFGWFFFL